MRTVCGTRYLAIRAFTFYRKLESLVTYESATSGSVYAKGMGLRQRRKRISYLHLHDLFVGCDHLIADGDGILQRHVGFLLRDLEIMGV